MTKQTIAIDIDDVLADSTEALRLLVNDRTKSHLTEEDYRVEGEYWGYYERVWTAHGLVDKVDYADFEKEMVVDQSHVPLLPSASFAVHELSKTYHIVLVTARDSSWESATRTWLKQHFAKDDIEIRFTGSRHDDTYRSKGELCKELGAFLMIDDNPGHCASVMEHGVQAILFGEYGWHTDIPDGIVRCKSWPEVLEYVAGL